MRSGCIASISRWSLRYCAEPRPARPVRQVLDEVVSKRIVIVEDEDHGLIVAARGRFQGFKVSMIKAKARRSLDSLAATCHAYSRFRQVFETLKP